MIIAEVTLCTADLGAMVAFFHDALDLPTRADEVRVGSSTLRLVERPAFDGVHHVAFSVAPEQFDATRAALASRVELLENDGTDIIAGPPPWQSRSVYFLAPDGLILEFIAHADRRGHGMGIAEVAVGVEDVGDAVKRLEEVGLTTYPPQSPQFAPVGDLDGMLILVDRERVFFPQRRRTPARLPMTVHVTAPGIDAAEVEVGPARVVVNA